MIGAGSVIQHMIAHGGNTQPPLFKGAISGSLYLPSQYHFNDHIPEVRHIPCLELYYDLTRWFTSKYIRNSSNWQGNMFPTSLFSTISVPHFDQLHERYRHLRVSHECRCGNTSSSKRSYQSLWLFRHFCRCPSRRRRFYSTLSIAADVKWTIERSKIITPIPRLRSMFLTQSHI